MSFVAKIMAGTRRRSISLDSCPNLRAAVRLFAQVFLAMAVQGAVQYHNWDIDYAFWSPDCVEKLIIAVNGTFPGPTIRATVGDKVVVTVANHLQTEGLVIHWHGIHQKGTPWADGAAYVTQCPISPGEVFTYNFTVENAGTYFWHGHYGLQRAAGLYGSLIVDPKPGVKEPFTYDGELIAMLNDWWHRSAVEQSFGLTDDPYHWVGEPQSLLIGGRGAYNCSLVPSGAVANSGDAVNCSALSSQCSPYVLSVEAGKTYRLRIVNVAALSAFNFIIEGHEFTVVEADAHYVAPVRLSNLDLYSGEAYSVLFTADQDPSRNYWAGINIRAREPKTPTGLAIVNYLPNLPTKLPTTAAPSGPLWDDYGYSMNQAGLYKARKGYEVPLPKRKTDRHITLLNTQNKFGPRTRWAANNVSFVTTATPTLEVIKFGFIPEDVPGGNNHPPPYHFTPGYDIYHAPENPNTTLGSGYHEFQLGDVVDVVLQNANTLKLNTSEIHPWHLHGHDFWVLGFGNGVFNASGYSTLNYVNPPRRNTVPLFPYGWTYIRYVANNPGAWMFHCHIEMHLHLGMSVTFVAGVKELASIHIPRQGLGCGLKKGLLSDP